MTFIAICILGAYEVKYTTTNLDDLIKYVRAADDAGYQCRIEAKGEKRSIP